MNFCNLWADLKCNWAYFTLLCATMLPQSGQRIPKIYWELEFFSKSNQKFPKTLFRITSISQCPSNWNFRFFMHFLRISTWFWANFEHIVPCVVQNATTECPEYVQNLIRIVIFTKDILKVPKILFGISNTFQCLSTLDFLDFHAFFTNFELILS